MPPRIDLHDFRDPRQCSRWSPYLWGGAGGIWGGNDNFVFVQSRDTFVREDGKEGSILGQVGGGIEYRFGRHLGAMTDLSWNITDTENWGMVRAGFTFSF